MYISTGLFHKFTVETFFKYYFVNHKKDSKCDTAEKVVFDTFVITHC